ncbi:spondin-1-like [Anthonomus grandis grandis]|uniref:spondin-1-like n=1 Tax=Anthonomus grandis grandis TaxID=2921223 RepID=UPI002164F3DD|nr:spondin-1-like [Anthonomus grandis grandis]
MIKMRLNYSHLSLIIVLISTAAVSKVEPLRCEKLPSDLVPLSQAKAEQSKTSENGKYILEIAGKPEKYVPNARYYVTIKVDFYRFESKFKSFRLSLESKGSPDGEDVGFQTGKFELGSNPLAKFSYTCPNTVMESDSLLKPNVSVIWIAPPPKSGCVSLRAIVIETREKWYADDENAFNGPLTKTLCEDGEENEDTMPEVLDFCGACDEAKYEMAFQGNWIRNNHPRGFPEDLFTTKFSDIVGASHKNGHSFWGEGEAPSNGLKELAFNGSTKSLEAELMADMENLHTIIKARGLSYPNITASSYSIFRVDNENHLVSMVTKMVPSPDWIVGVSNMELCLSNGSWKQYRKINLYPQDVGIDDSFEYLGHDMSTNEEPVVTAIKSSDPRYPFYIESEENMKPIAVLYFRLQKIYKKECDPERKPPEEEEKEPAGSSDSDDPSSVKDCEVTEWSKWSSCSVNCGKGHITKWREFKNETPQKMCDNVPLEETTECDSPCQSGEVEMHICPNTVWGPWKPCSAECTTGRKEEIAKGFQKRYRLKKPVNNEDDEEDDSCQNVETVECYRQC